jgi:hypothetical protein
MTVGSNHIIVNFLSAYKNESIFLTKVKNNIQSKKEYLFYLFFD